MKRKIALVLLATILVTTCMAMFCACTDKKPRAVEMEFVNPTTGEVLKNGDTIDLPELPRLIRVRIKDKETGEYLTDDDIPDNTIQGSCLINFIILDKDGKVYRQEEYTYWPTKKDIDSAFDCDFYEMKVSFNCRPENPQDGFKPKYALCFYSVRFYINKSWLEEE